MPKVLIADDDADSVELLIQALKRLDYEVLTADNGQDALHQALHAAPDLIILDILMPRIDGRDVARALKQDARTRRTPVIFITGLTAYPEGTGIEAGQDSVVLSKPVRIEEFVKLVRKTLGGAL
jgi:CheY-like chemotaxis protein